MTYAAGFQKLREDNGASDRASRRNVLLCQMSLYFSTKLTQKRVKSCTNRGKVMRNRGKVIQNRGKVIQNRGNVQINARFSVEIAGRFAQIPDRWGSSIRSHRNTIRVLLCGSNRRYAADTREV